MERLDNCIVLLRYILPILSIIMINPQYIAAINYYTILLSLYEVIRLLKHTSMISME